MEQHSIPTHSRQVQFLVLDMRVPMFLLSHMIIGVSNSQTTIHNLVLVLHQGLGLLAMVLILLILMTQTTQNLSGRLRIKEPQNIHYWCIHLTLERDLLLKVETL